MTRPRSSAFGAAWLMLLGAVVTLGGASVLQAGSNTCWRLFGVAGIGLHLDLLAFSPLCPQGAYLLTDSSRGLVRATIMVSASAVLVGLIALLTALGVGWWLRSAIRTAHRWLLVRLGLTVRELHFVLFSELRSWRPCLARAGSVAGGSTSRRGPPLVRC